MPRFQGRMKYFQVKMEGILFRVYRFPQALNLTLGWLNHDTVSSVPSRDHENCASGKTAPMTVLPSAASWPTSSDMGHGRVVPSPAELHLGLPVSLKSRHPLCDIVLIWEVTRHVKTLSLSKTLLIAALREHTSDRYDAKPHLPCQARPGSSLSHQGRGAQLRPERL